MLFYSFFKTLVGQKVTIQLKNDQSITGTLISVDQFLNFKIDQVENMEIKNAFIRGSVVRYVTIPKNMVDTGLLEDATRKELNKQ